MTLSVIPGFRTDKSSTAGISVGNTPLLILRRLFRSDCARIGVKAEWLNPGGSIKDRAVLSMIREGERSGSLSPDTQILDATTGNAGIAYAWIGARLGMKVLLCAPQNINARRMKIIEAYGAKLVLSDPLEGVDGAVRTARGICDENPGAYFYPDQYNNPANWQAHYETTAPEIWRQARQAGERVTHFVAGLGTCGTFMGVSRRMREFDPHVKIISLEPDRPIHGIEGFKHMASSVRPGIYEPQLADERLSISTEEAEDMVSRLAREEGILAGISGGANVAGAIRIARRLEDAGTEGFVVTVIPDSGDGLLEFPFPRRQ